MKIIRSAVAFVAAVVSFAVFASTPRVISVNYAGSNDTTQMTAEHCDAPLVEVPAGGWCNVTATGVVENVVIWDGARAVAVAETVTVASWGKIDNAHSGYTVTLQKYHLENADVTVSGIPFERYDVILYYAGHYVNATSYAYFSSADINGTAWGWDSSKMELAQGDFYGWNHYIPEGYEKYCCEMNEAPIIGHNTLRICNETSPTLTFKRSGNGYFHLAGFQVVEHPVPVFAPEGDTTVSAVNAAAVDGDSLIKVVLANGAKLTIDEEFAEGLSRVCLECGGSIRLATKDISDEQRQAALSKLDASGVAGTIHCSWGTRVISINFADNEARTVRTDADCSGELVPVGKAAGWNNITAVGTNTNLVVWDQIRATVAESMSVESKGELNRPNTNKTYPSVFQNAHLRSANITINNVPFKRYDVYIYYSARQYNKYGWFGTAKVNDTDWTYSYTGDGTTDVGEMIKGNEVWTNYQIDGQDIYALAEAPKLGHNVLIVRDETSSTLTLKKGMAGYFDIAAVQIVEHLVPPKVGVIILLQ